MSSPHFLRRAKYPGTDVCLCIGVGLAVGYVNRDFNEFEASLVLVRKGNEHANHRYLLFL